MGLLSGLMGHASEVSIDAVRQEFAPMLADGEKLEMAYKLVRDMFVFTSKRLILVNRQGMTGSKTEYLSIPYSQGNERKRSVTDRPAAFADVESCVDATIRRVGRQIRLGIPLGLGKANHIVNEFFRRARKDPRLDLRIFTALTLGRPRWKSDLERRLVEPLAERLFGGYPELAYLDPLRRGELPDNIRVTEFYFQPGSLLDSPLAQQHYISSNYTHVVRDLLDARINVLAQLVAKTQEDGEIRLSLSCNPDLTLDLAPRMREAERLGDKMALLAQVNRNLPFMYGDAAVAPEYFDALIDQPGYDFPLFAPPNPPVGTVDYLIALHASALIRDGGTLQLGIGSLGDAVTYLLKLRHESNDLYVDLLSETGMLDRFGAVIERVGGTGPFERGLYAATEMLVHGFLELYRCGILTRRVHDDAAVQRLLDAGEIGEDVPGAHVAHACFFLGPRSFYETLRRMGRSEREQIGMTGIAFVNQLYGQEELKRLQRRQARFVNSGLIVTLAGAVNSDGLEDGRVLSGVGGQYNFVAMAHALEDGRAILLIRSTREERGVLRSNIRASYGNITIPRHLRDIVVTEYGIAELRGRTDEEVATALVHIADSRFQEALLREAQRAGKVAKRYRIPDRFRGNRPEQLDRLLAPYRARGLFRPFPFGTDLTHEEIALRQALEYLKRIRTQKRLPLTQARHLRSVAVVPDSARPYLERMGLDAPRTLKERLMQRALVYALVSLEVI
jgi:acyl-CoA hydrolase